MRIRVTAGGRIGTTAFFRNRPLLDAVMQWLSPRRRRPVTALVHACSIGAEAWSLAIAWVLAGGHAEDLTIEATDIQPEFVAFAARGIYSADMLAGLTEAERAFFRPVEGGLTPVPQIADRVRFLPAAGVLDFPARRRYDLVVLNNVLVYVDAATQAAAFDNVAGYLDGLLVTTGFHQDRIADDLSRNGFSPVPTARRAIHDAWTDRLKRNGMTIADPRSAGLHTDPFLADYEEEPGFEWRLGALFEKTGSANPRR